MMVRPVAWMWAALLPGVALGIGPHEILLLFNGQSADSVEIARTYAQMRQVPERNVLRLDLPEHLTGSLRISPEAFTQHIWIPAVAGMQRREIDDRVLAWVYSVDFPVLVTTNPGMSIQGRTFLRNGRVDPERVKRGTWLSPLFGGPDERQGGQHFSQSFDTYKSWLRDDMPLPSMMLGQLGDPGNTSREIRAALQRGVESDQTQPPGTIYYITSDDVRSDCREWQFPRALDELFNLRVRAVITNAVPAGRDDIAGVMMGTTKIDPKRMGTFLPGAMAEHLTSFAGTFHRNHNQSHLTEWLAGGATASAGTVTEPLSLWTKFPNARVFVHYAAGCTMIESFFQSIRCPLQILLVGDPLARPWAPVSRMVLRGVDEQPLSGKVRIVAEIYGRGLVHFGRFTYYLDDREVGNERILELDTTTLANGTHTLRAVARQTGLVQGQVFRVEEIEVDNDR
jgi:uncharacterized protein (TIGR03790 family)